jgi:protocatechuate 3,4-dioxygenase beta subunit
VVHGDFPAYETTATTDAEVELTVPFGGGIEGQVRDAHTGQPVSGALVVASGPGKAETAAGQDGGIDLVPLAAGKWTLQASAPGYLSASTRVDVPAGSQPRQVTVRDLRLELARGATVAGTVRDRNGLRVRGATVTVGPASATTDEQGFFRMRDAPTGNVVITAEHHGARGTLAVSLAPGDELVTLEIHLQGTGDEP